MVVVVAFIVYQIDVLSSVLAYDRAAILDGQLWRLMTGHWVHFSQSHLVYDTLVLGMAGGIIEQSSRKLFASLCLLASFLTGIAMLVFEPRLNICGGLSGLATAAIIFLAATGLKEKGMWRWFSATVLLLAAAKILFEAVTGNFLFLNSPETSFVPVPINHFTGAVVGFGFGIRVIPKEQSEVMAPSPASE
jgi:rhomboid family GlyGly-CTERM serine protease